MRGIVTTAGPDGRSRVEREVELTDGRSELWAAPEGPLRLELSAPGEPMDLKVPPGGARWIVVTFAPGFESSMHWTRTLDFDTVLAGSVELILDEATVLLEAGDCAVVAGVRHAWRAGSEGCTLSASVLGVEG